MIKVAVVGAGAVGATIAAWLMEDATLDVTLCVRTPFERLRVVTPTGDLTTTPRIVVRPELAFPHDWVVVATKTYDADGASRWLDRLTGPSTRIAILQNGVEHRSRFPEVDPERLLLAIVDIPAERLGPGHVVQRRSGSMVVPAGPDGEAFGELFARSPIEILLTEDWTTAAWKKLAINCAGAVSALTLKPGGIVNDAEAAELMLGLVRECVAVGRAEGALLDDTLPDEVVEGYRAGPADSINSLLADRLSGRATEADARNGVIARLGGRHGIATPLNGMADVLLRKS